MTQQVLYEIANGQIMDWQDTSLFNYGAPTADKGVLEVTPDQFSAGTGTPATTYYVANPGTVNAALTQGTAPPLPLSDAELASQAYAAAIAQGIVVTSTGTTALNGTFGISADPDPFGNTDQSNIAAEQQYISDFDTFTDGSTTQFLWAQKDGAWVAFMSTAQFTAFAKFSAQYVSGCKVAAGLQAAGQTPTWPTNTVTIP